MRRRLGVPRDVANQGGWVAAVLVSLWKRATVQLVRGLGGVVGARGGKITVFHLFQYFADGIELRSGQRSRFKIECDALTAADWYTLASMAALVLPPFGEVLGVPTGGEPFARELRLYRSIDRGALLFADDVLMTGESMRSFRLAKQSDRRILGVVVFARVTPPPWVTPIFQLTPGAFDRV